MTGKPGSTFGRIEKRLRMLRSAQHDSASDLRQSYHRQTGNSTTPDGARTREPEKRMAAYCCGAGAAAGAAGGGGGGGSGWPSGMMVTLLR